MGGGRREFKSVKSVDDSEAPTSGGWLGNLAVKRETQTRGIAFSLSRYYEYSAGDGKRERTSHVPFVWGGGGGRKGERSTPYPNF